MIAIMEAHRRGTNRPERNQPRLKSELHHLTQKATRKIYQVLRYLFGVILIRLMNTG